MGLFDWLRGKRRPEISLEDPVLTMFAGDWVHDVRDRLGMSQSESITNSAITRQIVAAQQKTEGRTRGDLPAVSADNWFERNCPMLWEQRRGGA